MLARNTKIPTGGMIIKHDPAQVPKSALMILSVVTLYELHFGH